MDIGLTLECPLPPQREPDSGVCIAPTPAGMHLPGKRPTYTDFEKVAHAGDTSDYRIRCTLSEVSSSGEQSLPDRYAIRSAHDSPSKSRRSSQSLFPEEDQIASQ
jgi:hypothetical protein